MKSVVLIFTVLLSFIFGGNSASNACDIVINCTSAVVHYSNPDTTDKRVDFNGPAILPVRPASYSGDGNSFAPSFRSSNSARRVQPSTKSAFRQFSDNEGH